MKKYLLAVAVLLAVLLARDSEAQGCFGPGCGGSGSSGSSTITSGTTATSGCVAGGVLRSISNLVECGAGLTYNGTTLGLTGNILFGSSATIYGAGAGTTLRIGSGSASPSHSLLFDYSVGDTTLSSWGPGNTLLLDYSELSTSAINSGFNITTNNGASSAGFGTGLRFAGQSSTTASQDMIRVAGVWTDATHASRTANAQIQTVTSAGSLATVLSASSVGTRVGDATAPTAAFEVTNGAAAKGIMTLYDDATPVLTVADGGATTFATSLSSPTVNISGGALDFISQPGSWGMQGGVASCNYDLTTFCTKFGGNNNAARTWSFFVGSAPVLTIGMTDGQIASAYGQGSNGAGSALILTGGAGRGTGLGGDVSFNTSEATTSGTTVQALVPRSRVLAKYTTLTETTATAFARVAIPTSTVAGGDIVVTVEANDATDFQARTLTAPWSAVNKAGTITPVLGTPVESVAVSAGTLTCTLAVADATGGNMDFTADCTSSLSQTVLRANAQVRKNFGTGAISAR